VEELERQGEATPEARVIYAEQADDIESDEEGSPAAADALSTAAVDEATQRPLSAEDAIAELRQKIDRLGPVNMMAIEQFDEVEAPLDDANVGRFVEMLRAMLHHTQFILITHNRKTMEIADRLYGITMEEPGVSKLISVQLN